MQNKTGHVLSWIGLSSIPGVGRVTFRKLVRHFGSAERSLAASPGELRDVEGLSFKVVETIGAFDWRKPAEREVSKAEETGVAVITLDDPAYPGRSRVTAGALSGALVTLELKGLAKQLPGKYFVRIE